MSSNYWSSTTNANNTNNAWHVNFNNGNANNNNKSNSYYVRAVRGGKCNLLSFASVYQAYLDCRKRKRGTVNALRFEFDLLENLMQLALAIQQGTYQPSRSVCFVTTNPKLREVFAADFRDRVVHHLVVRELERIWEPKFIHDSYASRKGKGTHAAVQRLRDFMRQATRSMKRPAYYLQLDIRSFFMSIDRNILLAILEHGLARLEDDRLRDALLYLLCRIIFHDCAADYCFKGNATMLHQVPRHKSLFHVPPGKGLPIGNLTSQFLANVYLDVLDQFVKHTLKCRFYLRYVDDFVLVAEDRAQLKEWRQRISSFLAEVLTLELKDEGILQRVSSGVNFLGYIVRPTYRLVRKRVVNNFKARLAGYEKKLIVISTVNGKGFHRYLLTPDLVQELRQVVCSYLGHFKQANTFNLVQTLFRKYQWLGVYFIMAEGKIFDRFRCRSIFRSLKMQISFFRCRLGNEATIFVRVGKFYEIYDQDAVEAGTLLGLKLRENTRGLDRVAGFPAWLLPRYTEKILGMGRNLAVLEEGRLGRYVRERYVLELFNLQPSGQQTMETDNG